jgi:LPS sulfotransferase NodH
VTRPSSALLLCSLPRVGSSLLAELLHSTGLVGSAGEWFLYPERARLWREWGVDSHDAYLDRVLSEGTSANGVFAAKVMWGHMGEFLLYARRSARDYQSSDRTVIEALLPQPRFVWLRRDDTVAQAVSWTKAAQTDQWRAGGEVAPLVYSFAQIDWLVHQIRVWDGAWRRWFEAQRIDPLPLAYEELAADPAGVVDRVLGSLGLELPAAAPSSSMRKQADDVSEEWISRYLAEAR